MTPSARRGPRLPSSRRSPTSTWKTAELSAPELAVRIGLDSGLVVIDGSGEVFGEAPNVAAHVQTLAEAGTIVVTGSVHRQVAGPFVAEDKGAHELKGAPAPVTLCRIVRASGGGRRRGARTLTPRRLFPKRAGAHRGAEQGLRARRRLGAKD